MYVPSDFREDRVPVLHEAMRAIAFGTLVSLGPDGMVASHIPLLLDEAPAPFGTLTGHLARANPQGRGAVPETEALAIFLGPQAYVTPSWYPSKAETGRVVPTWNYVAIHAYGRLRFIDDVEWKRAHVTRLTQSQEGKRAAPWAVSDAPEDYLKGMLKGIIGFELPIARLDGKWKMSQNRKAEDRQGVIAGLGKEREASAQAVAAIMATRAAGTQ
jgi:transcriptional regulator